MVDEVTEKKSPKIIGKTTLIIATCTALATTAALSYLHFRLPGKLAADSLLATQQAAERQVESVNTEIRRLQSALKTVTLAEPALTLMNSAADTDEPVTASAALLAAQQQSLAALSGASELIIVPLSRRGTIDPYNEQLAQLNAIEIDLINRCLKKPTVLFEAQRSDKKWLLSAIHCADNGAIVMRYPLTGFKPLLARVSAGETQTELVQKFSNRAVVIARAALASPSQQTVETRLAVPNWTLRVTAATESEEAVANRDLMTTVLLGVLALCLLPIIVRIALLVLSKRNGGILKAGRTARSKRKKTPRGKSEMALAAGDSNHDAEAVSGGKHGEPDFAAAVAAQTGMHATPPEPDKKKATDNAGQAEEAAPIALEPVTAPSGSEIFRAYDIRGVADRDMDNEFCENAGRAIGSLIIERGEDSILLGRGGRLSSPRIHEHVTKGLLASGCKVTDLGIVPTPMVHFASFITGIGNVAVITGSHSAKDYNGIKISVDFTPLRAEEIQALHTRIMNTEFAGGAGSVSDFDVRQQYIDYICKDITIKEGMKVVIDAGNGATSEVGPHLFRALGCQVFTINCEIDGNFPAHPPDPTIAIHLHQLSAAVAEHNADLGIAFDGDGDRVVAVTGRGDVVRSDALLMLLARDVCRRNPGAKVVYDVKCSTLLKDVIVASGGEPVIWKSGHSHMKLKIAETEALVGGELSGHIFFRERWFGFDDGMYAAARLAEIISKEGIDLHKLTAALPRWESTPEILIPAGEQRKFEIVTEALQRANFGPAKIIDIDGIRVEYDDRWGLLRASNTGPAISLRFEGSDKSALVQIRDEFIELIEDIEPAAALLLTEHQFS